MQTPQIHPYDNPKSLEWSFRRARFHLVQALIDQCLADSGRCRILDIGGTEQYWRIAGDAIAKPGIHITLSNLQAPAVTNAAVFDSVAGNACDMPEHADMSFDLVHSNSVIEHVGHWQDMRKMAANVRRLAPAYFVQTPYFWFPVEPHFRSLGFHWLPEQMRYRRVMARNNGFRLKQDSVDAAMREVQSCVLLDKPQMRELFPDAELHDERLMGVMTKSLMAIRSGRKH